MRAILIGLALAVALAMPSRVEATPKYVIDGQVWGWYQQYLRNIANGNRPGAFVITRDGQSAFYTWCREIRCMAGPTYSQDALNHCEREFGEECVVFAVRDEIKVDYEIVASAPAGSSAPDLAPAPVSRISIAPAVQTEIDAYLIKAKGSARSWALALAKDGTAVESASCPVGGGWSGGRACEPVKGSPQELASREAIKRCGGPAQCILLYVGQQKQGNIEIVAR